jgi:hypothetical protein
MAKYNAENNRGIGIDFQKLTFIAEYNEISKSEVLLMMRHFQITEFDTRAILVFGLSLIE